MLTYSKQEFESSFCDILSHTRKAVVIWHQYRSGPEKGDTIRIEEIDKDLIRTGRYIDAIVTDVYPIVDCNSNYTHDILSIEIKHQYLIYNKQQ